MWVSMPRNRKKRRTGVESRGHFVISRLVVKHPFGWAVGGVLLSAGCLHGGIPLGDGCDEGGMGGIGGKVGTKLVPDTLGVPLVCPSGPKQLQCEWRV